MKSTTVSHKSAPNRRGTRYAFWGERPKMHSRHPFLVKLKKSQLSNRQNNSACGFTHVLRKARSIQKKINRVFEWPGNWSIWTLKIALSTAAILLVGRARLVWHRHTRHHCMSRDTGKVANEVQPDDRVATSRFYTVYVLYVMAAYCKEAAPVPNIYAGCNKCLILNFK